MDKIYIYIVSHIISQMLNVLMRRFHIARPDDKCRSVLLDPSIMYRNYEVLLI